MVDIRNIGLSAAVELAPYAGQPGLRALRLFERAPDEGLLVRFSGDIIALTPIYFDTAGRTCKRSQRRSRGQNRGAGI